MNQSIIDEARILAQFQDALRDNAPLNVKWRKRITRADGTIDETIIPKNIVTKDGLNALAARAIGVATSAIAYLAIGTVTAAHSLGSVVTGFGEISRKTPSILASSGEVVVVAMTWAGNADGLTGVALGSAACVNHASSGLGIAYNLTNSVSATLAASDFLLLQAEIQIGSHAL
jgi:hypothetical protein